MRRTSILRFRSDRYVSKISLQGKSIDYVKIPAEFQKFVDLDEYLSDFTEANLAKTVNLIEKSFNKESINYVFRFIAYFSKLRPLQHELLGELFTVLALNHHQLKPSIDQIVEINPIFARKLFSLGSYSINEINEIFERYPNLQAEFARKAANKTKQVSLHFKKIARPHSISESSSNPRLIFKVFSDLLKPGYPVSYRYTTGYPIDSIWEVIKFDNVEKLKEMVKQGDFIKLLQQEISICPFDNAYDSFDEIRIIDFAAYYSAEKCFNFLIEKYNTYMKISERTLVFAFHGGNFNIIKRLIDFGIYIHSGLMRIAAEQHYYDLVNYVIHHCIDNSFEISYPHVIRTRSIKYFFFIRENNVSDNPLLYLRDAIKYNDDVMLDAILYAANVKEQIILDPNNISGILCNAIRNNNEYIMNKLLSLNISPNQTYRGDSCLTLAAQNHNWKIIQLLLDKGASIESDDQGRSPINKIIKTGDLSIIKFFFERGAARTDPSRLKRPLTYSAIRSGNLDVIKYVLENCSDKDINDIGKSRKRKSIAYRVISLGNIEILQFLLSKGLNLDTQEELYILANNQLNYLDLIKILHENGYKAKEGEISHILYSSIKQHKENLIDYILTLPDIIVDPPTLAKLIKQHNISYFNKIVNYIDPTKYNYTSCITQLIQTKPFGLENIKSLVEKGVSVNIQQSSELSNRSSFIRISKTSSVSSPLSIALNLQKIDIAKYLIEKGADIIGGDCPVANAAKNSLEQLKLLTENNPNFDPSDSRVYSAVISENKIDVLDYLIGLCLNPNSKSPNGISILGCAIINSKPLIVKRLLDAGADPNMAANNQMRTPLIMAIEKRNEEIVNILLDYGADINFSYNNKRIPITFAIKKSRPTGVTSSIISSLLKRNPDLSIASSKRKITPLYQAVIGNNNSHIVKELIEHGADVNQKNEITGETALFRVRQLDIAKILIENGANINEVNNNGCTPLMRLVQMQNPMDLFNYFLEQGADPDLRDFGKTPADLSRDQDVRDYLKSL